MLIQALKRSNVTVDDRRAVFAAARVRTAKQVAVESHEFFIGNALRARLNWPQRDPNPESVVLAAQQMAAALIEVDKEVAAKKAATNKVEADKKAAQLAADAAYEAKFDTVAEVKAPE